MFDLGLSKLAVIGVVGLIVLGPERLPKVARVAGTLFGRAQRYLRDVKDEVSREMSLAELKDMGQSVSEQVASVQHDIQHTWREATNDVSGHAHAMVNDLNVGASTSYAHEGALNRMQPSLARRTGRAHWSVKTGRTPQWFKQHHQIRSRLSSEAARMSKHRAYAAHTKRTKPSFFE
ncbi:Sec-independent protein translocase protein TatB [Ephemeroptericola cinctiostellae]|uniref:Sec-independent protein translocase protein TatB n=1 Tax=Ephemeroptericola cinctiostellae TaxID=2268024 RepID=A0A345D996_9BURK|nr:Sec-independent protein translocase protein TatB [Ephemeroptericola cinctiostellae]AXF84934.1 Sec-independent protein translocase protein TatB [Ephemeroptericola cinctiostellae]